MSWAFVAPLALAGLYTLIVGTNFVAPRVNMVIDDVGSLVAAAWAGWACLAAARRSRVDRRPWTLLGIAMSSWAVGEAAWTWIEVVQHREVPFPSVADAGFLLFIPFAIVGIVGFVRTPGKGMSKVRGLLEAALVGCALVYISWVLVLDGIFDDTTIRPFGRVISLAYPVSDIVIIVVALFMLTRSRPAARAVLGLVAAGALALALSDSAFTYLTSTAAYGTNQAVDGGWVLGFCLIALAAARVTQTAKAADPADAADRAEGSATTSRLMLLAPYGVAAAAATVRLSLIDGKSLGLDTQVFFVLVVVALLASIVAVVLENHALTSTLEARVRARTAQVRSGEQRLFALLQDLAEVVIVCDADLIIRYASESVRQVLDRHPSAVAGDPLTAVAASADKEHLLLAVREVVETGSVATVDFLLAGSSPGQERWATARVRNLLDEPSVAGVVVNLREVTERRRLEDELRSQALRDSLTGLPNRTLFLERLDHALARCRRTGGSITVGMIDLDRFKTVNDSLGHHAGDDLLRQVAARLDPRVRGNDTVARLGGDEFAFLIESDLGGEDVAQRLLESLRPSFEVAGREVFASASIGLTDGGGGSDREELLRQADTAMYAAKRAGRGGFAPYEPAMHQQAVARLELEADLKRALERGELHDTGRVLGFEALMRWHHPTRGAVSPVEFIPVAEDTGVIVAMGRWVLHQACAQAAKWQRRDQVLSMSVNVSTVQVRAGTVVADVDDALAASGLDPTCLVVELTESVVAEDGDALAIVLAHLRDRGVRVAIDDFGTGYSSLAYLQRLPVDILKVDKAFVDGLGQGDQADGMVRAIVELASTLSADTVAEGVERADQADALRALGCHLAQGYLFARPLSPEDAEAVLVSGVLPAAIAV
jgi:diguanylate cyclase (GGDEF)-like protein/PAS domain S-box-containing protein